MKKLAIILLLLVSVDAEVVKIVPLSAPESANLNLLYKRLEAIRAQAVAAEKEYESVQMAVIKSHGGEVKNICLHGPSPSTSTTGVVIATNPPSYEFYSTPCWSITKDNHYLVKYD